MSFAMRAAICVLNLMNALFSGGYVTMSLTCCAAALSLVSSALPGSSAGGASCGPAPCDAVDGDDVLVVGAPELDGPRKEEEDMVATCFLWLGQYGRQAEAAGTYDVMGVIVRAS